MRRRRAKRIALASAVGVVAVVALVVVLAGGGGSGGNAGSGSSFDPLTAQFETFQGAKASLAAYQGKPVVVNFFASWCPGCYGEMPAFQQVSERLGDQAHFVGLSLQEPAAEAKALIARTGVTYQTGRDPDGKWYEAFGGTAMPTTVLIDKTGKVVEVDSGALPAATLEAKIRELLR